jgi:CBS-domain-containing membrane protein
MTEPCVTVFAEDELDKLLTIFKETSLNTVPVVDEEGNMHGIITRSDIIKTIKL